MFDTIILLTGPAEHSVFTTLLRGHNPKLTVLPVFTAEDLAAIEPEWLHRARLISFTTNVVVPGAVLGQLGYGAYHFHPGSPQYPGRARSRQGILGGGGGGGAKRRGPCRFRRTGPARGWDALPRANRTHPATANGSKPKLDAHGAVVGGRRQCRDLGPSFR